LSPSVGNPDGAGGRVSLSSCRAGEPAASRPVFREAVDLNPACAEMLYAPGTLGKEAMTAARKAAGPNVRFGS